MINKDKFALNLKELKKRIPTKPKICPAMEWILSRLEGFTIAMEPDFCGGLKKSNQLFHILENIFFTAPLFNKDLNNKKELKWRFLDSKF